LQILVIQGIIGEFVPTASNLCDKLPADVDVRLDAVMWLFVYEIE